MSGSAKNILKGLAEDSSLRGAMRKDGDGGARTGEELDAARRTNMAYEYLCHLEEAKKWMEACLKSELPPASELEGALRNGVIVAKLAMFFAPEQVKQKHIYDYDEAVFKEQGLRFRHTDNISRWTAAMKTKGFPEIFYPEVTDLYDKKNMPRVIYCIHALSRFLFQLGIAPKIQDLHGIAQFTEEEINAMDAELAKAGVQMPTFGSIGGVLAKELGQDTGTLEGVLAEITTAVEEGDVKRMLAGLRADMAGISGVDDSNGEAYLARLRELLKGGALTQDALQAAVRDVNQQRRDRELVDAITGAVKSGNNGALVEALRSTPWGLNVDPSAGPAYMAALRAALARGPLTPATVKDSVDSANAQHRREQALKAAVDRLNAAVDGEDPEATLVALRDESLSLVDVDEAGATQYHTQLRSAKTDKGAPLTRDDAQKCVTETNSIAEENAKHAAAIFALHEAVREKNAERTVAALQEPYCHVVDVRPELGRPYLDNLGQTLARVEADGAKSSKWKQCQAADGRTYYYNEETKVTQWVAPIDDAVLMTLEQVQGAVDKANADADRWAVFKARETDIVQLQARIRGALVRRAFLSRLDFLNGQGAHVVKIQSHVRGLQQRQRYQARLKYFRDHVDAIVRIQAAFKGARARRQYKNLTKVGDPPVTTVKRFLHLLDQSDADLAEELAVQQLKERVVVEIKQNVQLEHDLNQMDIKIGLLVKNRISLEDVVKQSKVLKRQQRQGAGSQGQLLSPSSNINALNKDSRRKLESFQHLFYLLQTQPFYLARLIFVDTPLPDWTAHRAQQFLQKVTETVYNLGSNAREQYLLLKLFRTALVYEVNEKIQSPRDFVIGNPTVVKLVMGHHRGSNAGNYLATTLGPVVNRLLAEDEQDLSVDPAEVYKSWLSKQEMETGEKSALPYEVTREVALEQPAVRAAVDELMRKVLSLCSALLDSIVNSLAELPYGLRSFSRELYSALRARFPAEPQEGLDKVVGNLLYYRYMNPALIAPETVDVVDASKTQISPLHRKGLGHLAKIMQFAASGQVFEEEGDSPLNSFLRSAWPRFQAFYHQAAEVPTLEEYYHIDEYSEAVLLSRPAIVISYHDMYWIHRMVVQNLVELAPREADPLRVVVADLGAPGDEKAELGEEDSAEFSANKTDISLTLVNKFEIPEQEDSSAKALFVRTKRMVVDVIRFRQGKSLPEILSSRPTPEDEAAYAQFIERRRREHEKAKRRAEEEPDRPAPPPPQMFASLAELMEKTNVNVQGLVREGLCSPENNYQDLLNAVAQDIRNQRIYRRQRKQELARLNSTVAELRRKQQYYTQVIGEYETYVSDCMKHMGVARPRRQGLSRLFRSGAKEDQAQEAWVAGKSVKYSAARLKEKGVVVSIDGASDSQLKHIYIEIVTTKDKGVFKVSASALMAPKTEMELLLEDLLQLQYQNIPTMKLFDVCVVNVNLLLFLINKKVFGSGK